MCLWSIFGFLTFSEIIIENNPYEDYFNEAKLKKLVEYIDVGQTADAIELGLDSKFQLECINQHLLTKCGLLVLKVRIYGVI